MEIHHKAFRRAFHDFHVEELHGDFRSELPGEKSEVMPRFLAESLASVYVSHAPDGGTGKFFHVMSAFFRFVQQQIKPGGAVAEGFAHHVADRAVIFSLVDDGHVMAPYVWNESCCIWG